MLFPIADDDHKLKHPGYVTIGLVVVNMLVFFLLQQVGANTSFTYGWSVIPLEITTGQDLVTPQAVFVNGRTITVPEAPGPRPIYLTILTAMFMHAGFAHLFGNMLYLWIFGDNVELRFGSGTFLAFYLASGIVATLVQVGMDPLSVVPNLGASGAISGVLGAYLVLFPRNRVYALFLFVFVISIPAVVAIGLWIAVQFINWGSVMMSAQTVDGVAYGAHVGGFLTGVVMALVLRKLIREEPEHPFTRIAVTDGSRRYW